MVVGVKYLSHWNLRLGVTSVIACNFVPNLAFYWAYGFLAAGAAPPLSDRVSEVVQRPSRCSTITISRPASSALMAASFRLTTGPFSCSKLNVRSPLSVGLMWYQYEPPGLIMAVPKAAPG